MIDKPEDLAWDLPYMQQASYLEGGPLMWMLPPYLHVNQKSDDDNDDDDDEFAHGIAVEITMAGVCRKTNIWRYFRKFSLLYH